MHDIIAERTINAPIERTWELVSDFANLSWYNGAEKVEHIRSGNADGSGDIRRITMPGMPEPVDEVLDSLDANSHTLQYHIPKTPMVGYRVTVSLVAAGDTQTAAKWHATFDHVDAEGLTPEMMIEIMEGTYSAMLGDIEASLTG